jgi:hypothetical protein
VLQDFCVEFRRLNYTKISDFLVPGSNEIHGFQSRSLPPMRPGRSASTAPNAKLREALGCLDLRLEDELTRYRRQRAGLSVAPIVLRPRQPDKKPLDLMTFSETATAEAPPVTTPPKAISFDLGVSTAKDISEPAIAESAMVPYEAETAGETLDEIANEGEVTDPPNDYLESSEHLLKSLKREEAQVEVERSFLQSLSTPFGFGSMLMLLLSSAMLGYVIMNPAIVTELWQNTAPQEIATTSEPSEGEDGAIPQSPPLDQEEFAELGLDTLSALRTKPAPIPTTIPSPSAIASPSPSPAQSAPAALVAPAPSTSPVASPQPSIAAGSSVLLPPVTVTKSPTNPPVQTVGNQYYRLEVPFTGDQSLAAARQVVPDAFLRSDGKIQLAATVTQAEAQRKAQELKDRGIAAEVKQP